MIEAKQLWTPTKMQKIEATTDTNMSIRGKKANSSGRKNIKRPATMAKCNYGHKEQLGL